MERRTAASPGLYTLAHAWLEAKEGLASINHRKPIPFNGSIDKYVSLKVFISIQRSRLLGTQDALTAAWRVLAVAEGYYVPAGYVVPDWFESEYPEGMFTDPETGVRTPVDAAEFDDSMEFYRTSDEEVIEELIDALGREERGRLVADAYALSEPRS